MVDLNHIRVLKKPSLSNNEEINKHMNNEDFKLYVDKCGKNKETFPIIYDKDNKIFGARCICGKQIIVEKNRRTGARTMTCESCGIHVCAETNRTIIQFFVKEVIKRLKECKNEI